MTEPGPSRDIINRLQDQLDRLRSEPTRDTEDQPPVGTGERMDGKVRVEAAGGRLTSLRLDPATLRKVPASELEAAVLAAVNEALQGMRDAQGAALPAVPSVEQLSRTLNEISTDSLRALNETTEGVRRSMAAIERISALHRPPQ